LQHFEDVIHKYVNKCITILLKTDEYKNKYISKKAGVSVCNIVHIKRQ